MNIPSKHERKKLYNALFIAMIAHYLGTRSMREVLVHYHKSAYGNYAVILGKLIAFDDEKLIKFCDSVCRSYEI